MSTDATQQVQSCRKTPSAELETPTRTGLTQTGSSGASNSLLHGDDDAGDDGDYYDVDHNDGGGMPRMLSTMTTTMAMTTKR
mgnify:CR=1 FL=1